jgi:hypothetical protein
VPPAAAEFEAVRPTPFAIPSNGFPASSPWEIPVHGLLDRSSSERERVWPLRAGRQMLQFNATE